MNPNQDQPTVRGFGEQWSRLDQSALEPEERRLLFSQYFRLFPWARLEKDAAGFDLGCGSGRWALLVAPLVGRLHLIDSSSEALDVAKRNLAGIPNCDFHLSSVEDIPLPDGSMDFGYALGMLHHLPDPSAGIRSAAAKLKPGAPLLVYVYYALENRPPWYRWLWRATDAGRRIISRLPLPARYAVTQAIAGLVYFPLARLARAVESAGMRPDWMPLAAYRHRSFYSMRTDALDRFGTRMEARFTADELRSMMSAAGLENITVSAEMPYWCAVGFKRDGPAAAATPRPRRKILYLVTEDWYFCSHRLGLAKAARDRGFEVCVATRVARHEDAIRREGLRLIPIGLRRSGRSPFGEALAAAELSRIYARERPDIVHHVAAKPILYGSLAAARARVPAVVNAVAGLGFAFTSPGWKASAFKTLLSRAYRWALNGGNSAAVFQNEDDIKLFVDHGIIAPGTARLIRGAGVDLERFKPAPEPKVLPDAGPVVLLASRLLWDKGVGEFIEAARELRQAGVRARFILAGDTDPDNPAAIPRETIAEWRDQGVVEWLGWRDDICGLLTQCHIACLPSYREGLPKILLEAAASGRPVVATDVPGCREIARREENGLLVPARDSRALAGALSRLIKDPVERARFGKRGREIVEAEFSLGRVIDQTLALYQELLEASGRPS